MFLSPLLAHKINLFAYDENRTLYIQSYFTKSSPCKQCAIKLLDQNDTLLLQLVTNDEGKTSTYLPSSSFSIIVEAGMGHQQRIFYEVAHEIKEEKKQQPSDAPMDKIIGGLAIIALFFGGLYWFKKCLRRS